MWHASVALRWGGGPCPTHQIDRKTTRIGRRLACQLIEGVGDGDFIVHTKQLAFHARRRLSPSELRALSPEWLAIEPVDMG